MSEHVAAQSTPTVVMIRCATSVNGQRLQAAQNIPKADWDSLPEAGRDLIRAEVRRTLAEDVLAELGFETTEREWLDFPDDEDSRS